MTCKWCPYIATESVKSDGKTRELFDDLKWHVSKTHPTEFREFNRKSWGAAMQMGQKLKKIRERTEELDDL